MTRIFCAFVFSAIFVLQVAHAQRVELRGFYPNTEFKPSDGSVLIEDGDTFWIGIHRVRLLGIDTIEVNQGCETDGKTIPCHDETLDFVKPIFEDPSLVCRPIMGKNEKPRIDAGGRYVVVCQTKAGEVNRRLVESGWALADKDKSVPSFSALEAAARKKRIGLHQYTFVHPYDFRNQPKKSVCPIPSK